MMVAEVMRNRRALSHMDPKIKTVHYRLEAWAQWFHETMPGAYPTRSVLGRLIDEGPGASQSTATGCDMPEAVQETHEAVLTLEPAERRIIEAYYRRWEPTETMARRCGVTSSLFDRILNRARWQLCGCLSRNG